MSDRRSEQRTAIDLLVNKYIGEDPHLCRAVNVSRRGMLLYKVFEPDLEISEVELEFQLPGEDHVFHAAGVTLAEHRWARAHGVRFTRISPEDAALLDAYLASPNRATATG